MNTNRTDTIAAISTAMAPSGIGIVRISGPAAVEAADRVFRSKSGKPLAETKSHTVRYGHIVDRDTVLDEVLVSVLRAPDTYTREDTIEINCHGGSLVLRRVLEAVLDGGVRLAEPGEFTKRAFLNGRIDLSQAEAVMDLIASENKTAADSAISQLGGVMRRKVEGLRDEILHETAYIEAALDDPEHYDLDGYAAELEKVLCEVRREIRAMLETCDEGRILKEGVATVILGRPNVGKSTLLNLLAGEERAIVTDIAGTTRDVLEEQIVLGGVPLRIMDTAGLRETGDAIESIGVSRARSCAETADLILYVLDGAQPLSPEDRENLTGLFGKEGALQKEVILVLNKGDLEQRTTVEEAASLLPGAPLIRMSAREGEGLTALSDTIRDMFLKGAVQSSGEVYITNLRHKEALERANESLTLALQSIRSSMPEDLYTVDLMDAYGALGAIIGADVSEDLIDRIFSEFCMGK
ncbi:MAG: tRNA uridine-5-carboxymethylaminomethyl(34) synthesis GTPase MnmE [Eubacterium sp.]|nr:tRNA uridine-5-carboxymethylaminomethyl(34) synthesis GTPase MnmE [Eubacterium sp.]